MTRSRSIPDSQKRVIEQLVADGLTDGQIGKEYGVTGSSVGRYRRKHGIETRYVPVARQIRRSRDTRAIPATHVEIVRKMVGGGMADEAIAKHYRCSASCVNQYRLRHGIARLVLTQRFERPQVRITRPREIGQYYDETIGHMVRVIEPCYAIGDLRPENENDEKRELERALHTGEAAETGRRPNYNPGWTAD